jgi:hypothetical protein
MDNNTSTLSGCEGIACKPLPQANTTSQAVQSTDTPHIIQQSYLSLQVHAHTPQPPALCDQPLAGVTDVTQVNKRRLVV